MISHMKVFFTESDSLLEIGNSSKITITITFEIFNVLLQLLSYFLYKIRPITITLAIIVLTITINFYLILFVIFSNLI